MARGWHTRSACPRWCDYAKQGPHSGPHVHHVGEVLLERKDTAFYVAVTIESKTDEPLPCLTVGGRYTSYTTAAMTWSEADRLASLLSEARHGYA